VGGNDAYLQAFGPEVAILGHESTREAVELGTRGSLEREIERRTRELSEQRARLARLRESGLLADMRAEMERSVEDMAAYLDHLGRLELRPPNVTFRTDRVLRLGDREVHLLHPGPAHTRGDVVVWLPADGVLAAGDLLEQGISIVGEGATPSGWAAALDSLARLEVRHLVPAHGPVQDRKLLDRQRDLFGTLVREVRRARDEGLTIEEAWDRVADAVEAALRGTGSDLPVPRAILLAWLEAAIPRAWSEQG
jgi:glyoxylase-like metal-dependent hydrolase (beta-lactamase superfamily II)